MHTRKKLLHAYLACEYINYKGLDGYWKGYNPPK